MKYVYFVSFIYMVKGGFATGMDEVTMQNEISSIADIKAIAAHIRQRSSVVEEPTILSYQLLRKISGP